MQFKVGDRVEVIKPAIGLIDEDKNNLGPGTVTSVVGQEVEVKVDTNDYPWWYHLDKVRPLIPAGAITIIKEDPPTTVADLTTPSITVGTQVRLTGVVSQVSGDDVIVALAKDGHNTLIATYSHFIEVIRQPFKRGEVVWPINDTISEPWLVVADEEDGKVTAVLEKVRPGHNVVSLDVRNYERRP